MILSSSSSYKQQIQSIIKDGVEHTCITTQQNGRKPIQKCITRRLKKKKRRKQKRKKHKKNTKKRKRRKRRKRGGRRKSTRRR